MEGNPRHRQEVGRQEPAVPRVPVRPHHRREEPVGECRDGAAEHRATERRSLNVEGGMGQIT